MAHPMMPKANHDERAGQLYTRDLKAYIASNLNPSVRRLAQTTETRLGASTGTCTGVEAVFDALFEHESFRTWVAMKRTAQEMMWTSVNETVDRELERLSARAAEPAPRGSLRLDPGFEPPDYVVRMDTHLMPGGYAVDEGAGSIRQGALMDAGGAVYQLGRPMGPRNDRGGVAIITHLVDNYPGLLPRRILDLGTGVGRAAVAAADAFPQAEVHAIDVGASILRYAHARAGHLGAAIHFSQQNAEHTDFAAGSFDLIVSSAIFHETSDAAIANILSESHRLLRPGGVCVHLEVPCRYWETDLLGRLEAEWETRYNNEPAYRTAVSTDFAPIFAASGFASSLAGWQRVTAAPGESGFTRAHPAGAFALYIASARR